MNKHYYILLDTETAGNLQSPLVYDLGFIVIDRKGNIYERQSLIITDIFGNPDLMNTAYYKEKIPKYLINISEQKSHVTNLFEAKTILKQLVEKYNIRAFIAHNAKFDIKALNNTMRYITNDKVRYFLPYEVEVWDTLLMAKNTIGQQKKYYKFCLKNGYITSRGTPRFTAEILYRYITNDVEFKEEHMGLSDCLIEYQIFVKCINLKMKMKKVLYKAERGVT